MSQQLREQLKQYKRKHNIQTPHPKKKKEDFSTRDIEELMGMNRPTYRRGRGGAIKQK
ncbi:hypothetical protein ACJA3J_05700 [Halobacillus sp. SY10]|uniref:hypothetical protein n=1 Tax=Halobacillus sp. SY10 TaxID=3381356 RepID=UPI0038797531